MGTIIRAIEYHLPDRELDNAELAARYPDWSIEKITAKTGIHRRHIAADGETALDLAEQAARKLFDGTGISPDSVDYLLFCTQAPDHFLPSSACILQHRLGLPTSVGALDFNLGCSGFVYGLGLAHGLIVAGLARRVLLLTGETYSKFIHDDDRSVRTIFGDGAAATLVMDDPRVSGFRGFVHGTDGHGATNLIVRGGAMRDRQPTNLYMNGAAVFEFTLREVPKLVAAVLERSGETPDSIDLYVFHQANEFMMEALRRRLRIAPEKFVNDIAHVGNTVSSTIPIALRDTTARARLRGGMKVMLVGFGVGYSLAGVVCDWADPVVPA